MDLQIHLDVELKLIDDDLMGVCQQVILFLMILIFFFS